MPLVTHARVAAVGESTTRSAQFLRAADAGREDRRAAWSNSRCGTCSSYPSMKRARDSSRRASASRFVSVSRTLDFLVLRLGAYRLLAFVRFRICFRCRRMRGWIAAWKAGTCISARVRLHDGSSSQGVSFPLLGPTAVLVYALFCVRLTYSIVSPKISPPAFLLQKSLGL
jgi:hypothetical protein